MDAAHPGNTTATQLQGIPNHIETIKSELQNSRTLQNYFSILSEQSKQDINVIVVTITSNYDIIVDELWK